MARLSALICLSLWVPALVTGKTLADFNLKHTLHIAELSKYEDFKNNPDVRVIYYFTQDKPRLQFFMKELDTAAEVLKLYGVQIGVVDCNEPSASEVTQCKTEKVDKLIYTYRAGNQLLALELETMFDVNSIMSNVLQLVMLRDVPILQTVAELNSFLKKQQGKHDVIFGHMKAIGTADHRVFMEVAFAYLSVFKFAICTDKEAASKLQKGGVKSGVSSVWWIHTKQAVPTDTTYHNVQYIGKYNLADFAKYIAAIAKPALFDIPSHGYEHPYGSTLPIIRLYYNAATRDQVYQFAAISQTYLGFIHIVLINTEAFKEHFPDGPMPGLPAMSMGFEGKDEVFVEDELTEESVVQFVKQTAYGQLGYDQDDGEEDKSEPATASAQEEDGEYLDDLEEEIQQVENQDDPVAFAVHRTSDVPMMLDRVTALTDKSFPQVLKESSAPVVTLFYHSIDALSLANLRLYGETAEMLTTPINVKLTRVNCYDWTDVCQAQNITMFPTLRVFRDGEKAWDYKGPQDKGAMYTMIRILELSPPVQVADPVVLMNYLVGQGDLDVSKFTNVTVVGLFSDKNKKEMETFSEVAVENPSDRILYVYMDSKDAVKIADQFGVSVPAVILSRFDDKIQPHVKYTGDFDVSNLHEFVYNNKLPKLNLLTPLMFPELRARSSDFIILFTDGGAECHEPEEVMRELVKGQAFRNVSFTMMPVVEETDVGRSVLELYATEAQVPHISYVNLDKGEVFNYVGEDFQKERLSKWIGAVVDRSVQPSTILKEGKWTPVVKGYDFLKFVDEAKREKRKNSRDGRDGGQSSNVDADAGRETEDIDDESTESAENDAGTRADLFNQKESRLYQSGRGRMPDRHDHGKRGGMDHKHEAGKAGSGKPTHSKEEVRGHDPSEL